MAGLSMAPMAGQISAKLQTVNRLYADFHSIFTRCGFDGGMIQGLR
jgi:hypothetical protein